MNSIKAKSVSILLNSTQFLPRKCLSEVLYIRDWILSCSTNSLDQTCLPGNGCCKSNNAASERAGWLAYKLSRTAAASNGVLRKGIAWKTGVFKGELLTCNTR